MDPDPAEPCRSPNRQLWRTVTELQQQNSELRVKVEQLRRSSSVAIVVPGSESIVGRESGKFLKMELERERSGSMALKQQLDVALVGSAAKDEQLAECQAALAARDKQVVEFQRALAAKDEQLAKFQAALAAREEQAAQCQGDPVAKDERQLPEGQAALAAKEEQPSSCQAALAATERQLAGCQTALAATEAQLSSYQANLAATEKQLAGCQTTLAAKEAELSSCQANLAATEKQLAACQAALLDREGKLSEVHQELRAVQRQLAAKEGELGATKGQLQGARSLAQFTESELRKCRQQLQECEAKAQAQERELAAALQQAERSQLAQATMSQLEVQPLAAAAAAAAAAGQQAGTPPASPTVSLGAKSDGGYSPIASDAAGGTSPPASHNLRLLAVPRASTTTVFNVMIDGPGAADDGAAAAELQRLTHQVVSLQDKLEALQAAHEQLLGDYSTVSEQLAARQAEAQMARLSPESAQLKQQVQGLQEQVAALQQELFHCHMQSIAGSASGRGSPTGSAGLGPANKEGRSVKRSFTRAASSLGQRLLHPLRRQKSTASLGAGLVDSRASSLTESVTSVHSCSMAIQSLQHSVHSTSGAGAGRFSPSVSPLAGSMGLLSPAEMSPGTSPRLAGGSLFASPVLASLEPEATLLALRQQLAERSVEVDSLRARLGAEVQRAEHMQEALLKQGIELQEARQALAASTARLEEVEALAAEMQAGVPPVAAECQLPAGAEHARCREAADHLTRQVWRERMARQKVEYQLEQERSRASRLSEASEVDESLLERLQAEAQAADTMSAELHKARGHQLQLQQRIEALQLQLAKQTALLESATRGAGAVTLAGARTGSPFRSPRSPTKADVEKHNLLRVAELKAEEATLKLALCEREVTRLQRQERRLNQALSQAADWRRRQERLQEESTAAWKRRVEKERTTVAQLESRLRVSVASQQGLLSGLEALQALLQTKSPGDGSPLSRRTTAPHPSSPGITPYSAFPAGMQQEALRQVSSLLRKCTFRLQHCSSDLLLSPQHSHSEGGAARSSDAKPGSGGSLGAGHQSLSISALAGIPAERLSDPAEPQSPRGRGHRTEVQRRPSLAKLRAPPQLAQAQEQEQEQAKPVEVAQSLDMLLAILKPGEGEGGAAPAPAPAVAPAAGPADGDRGGPEQSAVSAPAAPEVAHSSFRLDLPEGSRGSMLVPGIDLGRASLSSVGSDCMYDPDARANPPSPGRLPPPSRALSSRGSGDKDMRIPAHRPSNSHRSGGGPEQPPKLAAASPRVQEKQAGGGGSPRLRALMGALKRSVGIGCKETSTHSGKSTPAQAAVKSATASPRRSSTGMQQSVGSPRRSSTGMRDVAHEGSKAALARSPRKAWL